MTTNKTKFEVVGQPRRRVDARAKVTGQTHFADDLVLPRMLHCKLLRSPHPHANIKSIDTSRAIAAPGVKLVLTAKDLPVTFSVMPSTQDEYPLAMDRVRYIGDPVAAVIAKDERTAEDALGLIQVEYEVLPTIASAQQALDQPEVRIHHHREQGNIHRIHAHEFGDVEEALARSDRVFEDLFFYEGSTHAAIEEHATLAAVEGDGKLTVWSSTQCPHYLHLTLAKVLKKPPAQIRVVACANGGGFGGKVDLANHEFVVAKAALTLGRPVKICLTRQEVFYLHRARHPVLMKFRTGVTKDGRLTGMHLQTLLDGGAYSSGGVAATFYTGVMTPVTYQLPRFKFEACRMFTNKPACGPKRGNGTPQPRFGQEVQLDKIAETLGLDPAEMRLKMVNQPNSLTASWQRISTIGLAECIRQVVARSGWKRKHRQLAKGKGVGLACSAYQSGAGVAILWDSMPHSGVQLLVDRSGQVTVFCGSTEIGQGSDNVLVTLVAEVLGIDPEDVRCVTGDTAMTPVDLGSYSSRVTVMMGNAAIQAAERIRVLLAEAAAEQLAISATAVAFSHGRVFSVHDSNKAMTFAEAVAHAEAKHGTLGSVGSYAPPKPLGKFKAAGIGPSPAYSFSACVVEVEVDDTTGWITVPKVWIAHDIGRAINPVLARGQVIGSVYMGLGEALMEAQAFRRLPGELSSALVHRTPSLLEYKTLTAADMPEVEAILVEDPDPNCPFGAKEVGQGPILPVMPAVANAVYDAVGVRIDEVPITPEKVLRALDRKAKGEAPRVGPEHFPAVPYPEPIFVVPPSEGGDGSASKKPIRRQAMAAAS